MIKSTEVTTYLSALSLPRGVALQYANIVSEWVVNSGEEWTVSRCKAIYTDLIRYKAGEPLVGKWYKKNRDGLPKGVLSRLFKYALLNKKNFFQVMTLLRVYTKFISKTVTSKQLDKFVSGVESELTSDISALTSIVVKTGLQYIGRVRSLINQKSFISYTPSPGKRVPSYWGASLSEEDNWSTQWETLEETVTGRHLRLKYHKIFRGVFAGFTPMRIGVKSFGPTAVDSVGKIGLIQEPGYKLRAVANPNRVYQVALEPLFDIIADTIKGLPWDCTFDQSKAIPTIQSHLQLGRTAYCVDLSGATDYFPLKLQLDLLHELFPDHVDYINLFEELSRAPWFFQDTTIRWNKGQPLGLLPSFVSFALTHGLLLLSLNGGNYENNFFVLGDDVVILDDGLYRRYRLALKALQCPVSDEKSIISKDIAEFGGKIISKDMVLPQLKWRQLSDDNFVDIVKLLGRKSIRLLRPRQRKVVKLIEDIPDFLGGLGFNPNGLPLETRIEKYLNLFGEENGTFLMSLDRKHNSFFMNETASPNSSRSLHIWNGSELPDLDQRSAALCLKHLPTLIRWYGILGTNLYSVVPNKDVLPIDGLTSKRTTLLARLERRLM